MDYISLCVGFVGAARRDGTGAEHSGGLDWR
jgi:hypothetical protein